VHGLLRRGGAGREVAADRRAAGALLAGRRREVPACRGTRGSTSTPSTSSSTASPAWWTLARESDKSFGGDPRGGPWVSVLRRDRAFAEAYAALDPDAYRLLLAVTARTLFDRDTAPGAEPEDLLRLDLPALIVPGRDHAHAVSAARYFEECFKRAEYWDDPRRPADRSHVPARLLSFLAA
jgi:hypothetical protein